MRGQGRLVGNGSSENALLTAASARFGSAVAVDEAEVPVVDVEAPAVPLVGPREDEDPGGPAGEGAATCQSSARACASWLWRRLSRPVSVTISGRSPADVLEPGEVGLELRPGLEEDVEADDVHERQLEVLRAGVVDVGDERPRVLVLAVAVELLQEALDPVPAVPADDRGGNLVADRVAEDRRVAGAGPDALTDPLADRRDPLGGRPGR